MTEPVDVPTLRRTAYLLHGDWAGADDLVHRTLTGRPADHPAARAALVRRWLAAPTPGDPTRLRALAAMPPARRACVVLRYWERCSVAETARLLDCSIEDVDRETAKGRDTLRTGSDRKPD